MKRLPLKSPRTVNGSDDPRAAQLTLEDRLSSVALSSFLSLLVLERLLGLDHLLGDILIHAQGLLFLPPLAPGLHPGNQTQHGSSNDRRDARQRSGVRAAQKFMRLPDALSRHAYLRLKYSM
ncbi:hypothetical protein EYF80_004456 [Liparis tanakae]|uniref:Uncharacterized protein n=1 Tax=Liparis tanakae TaxID=230148 RepID=A0A4Z2J6D5_9TELE|nr:hypothetical protein EYF80_004456 [Liparis tanakae]